VRLARAVAVGVLVLAASAVPAAACSGPPETEAVRYFGADLVFAGTVVGREDPVPPGAPFSSGDTITWTFAVDATRRGEHAATRTVTSARDDGVCGYVFRARRAVRRVSPAATGARAAAPTPCTGRVRRWEGSP
jgi:hypothetical protein